MMVTDVKDWPRGEFIVDIYRDKQDSDEFFPAARKVVQIAAQPLGAHNARYVIALCNDGALFALSPKGEWNALPEIPQP